MQLSELLRQVLDTEPAKQSTLNDELAFVRRYLDIMQMRIGDRLRLTEDIEPQTGAARVPSLVLQPLVENAVVHGISKSTRAGEVQIRARRSAEMLVIEVLDDGPGPSNAPARQGVGLTNTRLLLEQLYGRRHALTLEARAEGGTATRLVIPFTVVP
jgi:sensor histidine kinase YesM